MNRAYLDHLYEWKFIVRESIDILVEKSKDPQHQCCKEMPLIDRYEKAIISKRLEISNINESINMYLKTHQMEGKR